MISPRSREGSEDQNSRTRARAFVLVLSKGLVGHPYISLRKVDRAGKLSEPIRIPPFRAEERLDYAFHAIPSHGRTRNLADLDAHVVRGSLEFAETFGLPYPIFHTTDFPAGPGRFAHVLPGDGDFSSKRKLVIAEPGDILVARVDRSLHRKVCGISKGRAVLTNVVHRIRVNGADRDIVLRALLSPEGETSLAATARGVGARMLGRQNLMNMPLLP